MLDRPARPLVWLSILAVASALGATIGAAPARAHSVTVDGATTEWSARVPNGADLGILARDASQAGELVWIDTRGDTRMDLASPETGADLTRFAVTADSANLYFRVTLGPDSAVASAVQLQIAIDVDRTAGSGNTPFAGFADTSVAPEAAWERLVQTRGGLGGSVQVRDTAYAVVGMGTIATNTTSHETEIAIPWALLPAGTIDALRFTVATFRENGATGDTIDIAGTSDALDVITDYGDPGLVANTWDEVMDGIVGHSLEVWLARGTREPYAPLLVSRFAVDPAALEWFEIRNQTGVALDLATYCVGDEPNPDGPDFMGCFPPTSSIAAAGVVTIAKNATAFAAAFGASADYETGPGAGGPPDLVTLATWDGPGASFALDNGGDELVVLGWNRTIVDVVVYQLGSYPGITPRFAPGVNRIAVRSPATNDTDDCVVDFPLTLDDCGPGAGTCGTCRACQRFACVVDIGASCDDGDMCTTGTTCDASAVCGGGSMVDCADANACTVDSCSTSLGCQHTVSAGALCSDGDACTMGDVCSAAGVCGGTALDCDDANPCTNDMCSAGGCTHVAAVGRTCTDGSMCTSGDACNASGACVGTTVTCPEDANPCTTASCSAATGCGFTNNTASCDDGNACTSGDVCSMGTCRGTGSCDAASPMADAAVPMPDAFVVVPDAAMSMADAFVVGEDAAVTSDDAGSTGEDAGAVEDGGAAVEDTGVAGEDAGAMMDLDASLPGGDASASDAGANDGGRRDGGGLDASGSGLPPSSSGCSCRVGSSGVGSSGPRAIASLLALGLALTWLSRRGRRRARRG